MRKLYSATTKCSLGCTYCFAKWGSAYDKQPLFEISNINDDEAIVYPCCDGEFFDQENYIAILRSIIAKMDKVYISISTKKRLDGGMLSSLRKLNDYLIEQKKGFVKFSVSVSTKSRIEEIEPYTLTYEERVAIVQRLSKIGIPSSLTLKPILPFVPVEEYFEIIDDFSDLTGHVLLGGLYVCPHTDFYAKYIEGKYFTEKREVSWLAGKPYWDYVVDSAKIEQIQQYAKSKNLIPCDSDIDVIKSFTTEIKERKKEKWTSWRG